MTVEIAVQDVEGARIAHEEGADRVELCAALMGTGGLTPSFGMIQACSHVGVPQGIQVLIRPRGGSFVFTDEEKNVQIADVRSAILAGASGVVVGGMTEDGRIDVPFTRALAEAAAAQGVSVVAGVDRYAAQGIKLYSLSPLPFLAYLLKEDALLGGLGDLGFGETSEKHEAESDEDEE